MPKTSSFLLPTRLLQGVGCFDQLGTVTAAVGHKALLVCGRSARDRTGLLARAEALLDQAALGHGAYAEVSPEPTLDVVEQGIAMLRQAQCDVVIGMGGGSAMDVAKAIAGLARLPGQVAAYHQGRTLDGPALPFIAVPTTAGTGAEVTKNAVLSNPATGVKASIRGDDWFARVALIDPQLTLTVPPAVTAASGADALCQAIEAYVSIGASPVTDGLCERAIRLIGRSLEQAYTDGDDLQARSDMLYGSLLAGMALANARLGAVHGMAHPLGIRYHVAHGVICGLLLPHVMRYNLDHATAKYAQIARLMNPDPNLPEAEAAKRSVDQVEALLVDIDIPLHLRDIGADRADWTQIIEQSLPSGSLKHNPRPMAAHDVHAVLEMAW